MPKLNILKHKSWHVWNEKAIARVKRDEAEAKEREAIEAAGVRKERINKLRRKRDIGGREDEGQSLPKATSSAGSPQPGKRQRVDDAFCMRLDHDKESLSPWYTSTVERKRKLGRRADDREKARSDPLVAMKKWSTAESVGLLKPFERLSRNQSKEEVSRQREDHELAREHRLLAKLGVMEETDVSKPKGKYFQQFHPNWTLSSTAPGRGRRSSRL